ncbi:LysM peptidoglycan-binding domain-containing protein [Niallia endozanthoxylica]|uniref:LysM peptidoglycan-binding domain-containing protein n=1 Tax=Niallia endozanthoxylica TaxID=2036016 RepID=A0A5J5H743_9BACI|nr:LysM peptidoglycan-binding domain-containing protein [Niallia endozanthoxylica]KAA9016459.1 LysM peptidoglycan-binding domain-containing protein [Niallia endozanthoxylica]
MPVHVVKDGESLWAISRNYSVPSSTIVRLNGLTSGNTIVPGLALYIPENGRLLIRVHQVKAGDTLWGIARRYNTSVPAIVNENPSLVVSNILSVGQILRIPSPVKLGISTLGFILPFSLEASIQSLEAVADQLTYLAVAAYSLTNEGYAFMNLNDSGLVERCRQLNVIPLLMIRNLSDGFNPELIGSVLGNPMYRNHLIISLVQLAKQRGYEGVSIDFEFIPPERRNDFILFLRDLKAQLGDLILHVNVHAKSEDLPLNPIVGGYDYRAIGVISDIVAVMTIDYGYPTGPPDPIAPIGWVEQVIQYAITQINPRKLQISLPLYGYDKVVPSYLTTAMSVQNAQNFALSMEVPIQYDVAAQAPWYRYWRGSEEHIVWFEDIRSYIEKYNLMDFYQLFGTTFWQIALPAPQNWAYIRNNINIIKF